MMFTICKRLGQSLAGNNKEKENISLVLVISMRETTFFYAKKTKLAFKKMGT